MKRRIMSFVIMLSVILTLFVPIQNVQASEWILASQLPAGAYVTEEKYTYNQTLYTTSSSSSLSGWEKYDTTWEWGSYGSWSDWTDKEKTKSDSRQVKTRTMYNYYRWAKSYNASTGSQHETSVNTTKYKYKITDELKETSSGSGKYKLYHDSNGDYDKNGSSYHSVWKRTDFKTTQYKYRDRSKVYTYYYKTTENKESTTYPSGDNISNIQRWVKYEYYHYYLDLNGMLDDAYSSGIANFGTADVYINGTLVANDVSDYYASHIYGTKYEITDIKSISGHTYHGTYSGFLSGTMTADTSVVLKYYSDRIIKYNANGGTNAPGNQSKPYGTNVSISQAIPQKPGYTFKEWRTATDGTGDRYVPGGIYSSNTNVTLYAQWTANTFTINYDGNGADKGTAMQSTHTYDGNSNFADCEFSKTGYTFAGWSLNQESSEAEYSAGAKVPNLAESSEITLYAVWKPNQYSIKYAPNGGVRYDSDNNAMYDDSGIPIPMEDTSVIYDGESVTLAKNEYRKEGYRFKGWSRKADASAETYQDEAVIESTLSATNDVTLYAVWKEIPSTNIVEVDEIPLVGKKQIKLHTGTAGAEIYYTIDGSNPTVNSTKYDSSKPLEFSSVGKTVIKAFALKEGNMQSEITEYVVNVEKAPVVQLQSNNISTGKSITMTLSDESIEECEIYYTTDGSEPMVNSKRYYAELQYSRTTDMEIKAAAIAKGFVTGEISSIHVSVEKLNAPEAEVIESYPGFATIEMKNNAVGATIYYTVENGESPISSQSSLEYKGNFEIKNDTDHILTVPVKAVAMKDGYVPSDIVTVTAVISDRDVVIPTVQMSAVYGGKMVSLSCETEDVNIYYTEDGSEPGATSIPYNGEFFVNENETVKAIAVYENIFKSPVLETEITVGTKMNKPTITLETGEDKTKVTMEGNSTASTIYYTLDTTEDNEPILYTKPFYVFKKTQIKAYAVRKGYATSDIAEVEAIVLTQSTANVQTLEASNVTETSAVLNGTFSNSNGSIIEKSFIYYEKSNPNAVYYARADENSSALIQNLKQDTEYWYQAIAINAKGIGSGTVKSFRTLKSEVEIPTKVKLSPEFISINVGDTSTITAEVLPEYPNQKLIWSSSNSAVAKVNQKGVVTALGKGSAVITAKTSVGQIKGTMQVIVTGTVINGELDFSEISMAKNVSEIWNKNNTENTFKVDGVIFGGNSVMSTAYLARWGGTVLEDRDPYPSSLSELNVKQYSSDYHVQEVLFLPPRKDALDNNDIKNAIVNYGAVYSEFKVDYNYFNIKNGYLKNYYLAKESEKAGGHAIAIVGWDDNYSKYNFKTGLRPPANGAFICKNSWGTEDKYSTVGEDGYFYISYYDPYIGRHGINAVFNSLESNTNYSKNYQYDPLGPVLNKEYPEGEIYMSNVFPQKGEVLENDETLKAVSFYTADKGYSYEVYVIPEFNDDEFFENIGSCVQRGVMEYAGYHTVKLDNPIELKAGSRFAVIVRLTSTEGKVSTYFEAPLESMAAENAIAHEGESYVSEDGKNWQDVHVEICKNTNVCIKAFTDTDEDVISLMTEKVLDTSESSTLTVDEALSKGFQINPQFIEELDSIELFDVGNSDDEHMKGIVSPSISVGNNDVNNTEGIQFKEKYDLRKGGKSLSKVKDQGVFNTCWAFATYASLESCVMKKAHGIKYYEGMSGSGGSAAVNYGSLYIPVTAVDIEQSSIKIAKDNSMSLYAEVSPYNATDRAIVWESSNPSVATVDTSGNICALALGETTITVTNPDSGCTANCLITVTEPQPISGLTVSEQELYFDVGDEIIVDYDILPGNALKSDVKYTVEDETIVSEEDGILYAIAEGETYITVSTLDGEFSDKVHIYVNLEEPMNTSTELILSAEQTESGVEAEIINLTNNFVNVDIYYAIYNKSTGQLKSVYSEKNVEISSDDIYTYTSDVSISTGETAKIFVWEADTMKPVCTAEMIE